MYQISKFRWIKAFLFAVSCLLFLGMSSTYATSEALIVPSSLEVTVRSLHVRESPPQFRWKTLFTFKYVVEPPIAVLKKGVVVTAKDVVYVGRNQRWVKISYENNHALVEGWIYTGQKPNLVNVNMVSDEQQPQELNLSPLSLNGSTQLDGLEHKRFASFLFNSLFNQVYAADAQINGEQVLPVNDAPTIQVLIFQLIYVFVFVGSFVVFYRLTKDKWLTTFGSVSVLLIFGFVSQTALLGLLSS